MQPDRRELKYAWDTGIGLQAVDRLTTSEYLLQTARRSIEGEISLPEAESLISRYYEEAPSHVSDRTEEADKVAARIASVLADRSFVFAPTQYLSIHRRLFLGIYPHAGQMRDYNISKKEWVLNGDSVMYGGADALRATLEYDLTVEQQFDYADLTMTEMVRHLARFVANLWQIHVFSEGNTRTTAVFFIKYLRMRGFRVTNDVFAANAWYFRNALVRANYSNISIGVHATTEYLELFLRNLLMDEQNKLKNRYLHVDWGKSFPESGSGKQDIASQKQDIGARKQDIGVWEQDIAGQEQDISSVGQLNVARDRLLQKLSAADLSPRCRDHILKLFDSFGMDVIFGRREVMDVLGITESPASALLRRMREQNLMESVKGVGKGKYRFRP